MEKARAAGAVGYLTKEQDRRRARAWRARGGGRLSYPAAHDCRFWVFTELGVFSMIHVVLSAALVTLILMHSGRDAGFGGMGFTPTSQGGTHIVERNLTRLTAVVVGAVLREHDHPVPPARVGRP